MCELCHGIGCPACEEEVRYERCEGCDGLGVILLNADGEPLTRQRYDALPESERLMDVCDACRGRGEVAEEKDY
jgi:DnaJ-class molecular chaperone